MKTLSARKMLRGSNQGGARTFSPPGLPINTINMATSNTAVFVADKLYGLLPLKNGVLCDQARTELHQHGLDDSTIDFIVSTHTGQQKPLYDEHIRDNKKRMKELQGLHEDVESDEDFRNENHDMATKPGPLQEFHKSLEESLEANLRASRDRRAEFVAAYPEYEWARAWGKA